jgi:antitoxin (DNA-binding transcriptional repressor) of toxin-antitoxin stability system
MCELECVVICMVIDMTYYMTFHITMKTASVAELKKNLSSFLVMAQEGEDIEVLKRNVPVAHLVGIPRVAKNKTRLGCGKGTGRILGDLTESLLPPERWNMLRGEL